MNILRRLREEARAYDCGVCGTNHGRSEIRLLGKIEAMYVVRVTCSKCTTSFKLLVEERGLARPVKEDPGPRRPPPVTADDVLDAHDFLEGFDGDVRELLGTRGKVGGPSTAS